MKLLEWFNQNENSPYPIAEDSTGKDNSGNVCPYAFIADLGLTVAENYADDIYLSQLTVTPTMVSVSFAIQDYGFAVGTFRQPIVPYRSYSLTPIFDRASGFIVFGYAVTSVTEFMQYQFDSVVQSRIDGNAILPIQGPEVTALGKLNGSVDDYTEGVITLQAGNNIVLDHEGNIIKVSLIDSARTEFVGPCDKYAIFDSCGGVPIRSINGVPGDEDGKLTIEVE